MSVEPRKSDGIFRYFPQSFQKNVETMPRCTNTTSFPMMHGFASIRIKTASVSETVSKSGGLL
jgi:hypothetical protein